MALVVNKICKSGCINLRAFQDGIGKERGKHEAHKSLFVQLLRLLLRPMQLQVPCDFETFVDRGGAVPLHVVPGILRWRGWVDQTRPGGRPGGRPPGAHLLLPRAGKDVSGQDKLDPEGRHPRRRRPLSPLGHGHQQRLLGAFEIHFSLPAWACVGCRTWPSPIRWRDQQHH